MSSLCYLPDEAVARAGMTLDELIKLGAPVIRLGRAKRFPKLAFDHWLAGGPTPAQGVSNLELAPHPALPTPSEAAPLSASFRPGVYVITGGNLQKIGVADHPDRRLRALQTANGVRLVLVFFLRTHRRALDVERQAHKSLDAWRREGEWFEVTADVAVATVLNAAGKQG